VAPLGRLHIITDTRPGRDALAVVTAALSAGAPVIQVRVADETSDREAYEFASRARALCADHDATCLVNDRLHVALAVGAHGAHVGADDLPVGVARRVLGPDAVLGATAREPATARAAVADGASYVGVGPAFATRTKRGLPDAIGPAGVAAVAAAVPGTPVVAIGAVTADRVPSLLAAGAYGVAVIGAVSDAADPAEATGDLLRALGSPVAGTPTAGSPAAAETSSGAETPSVAGGRP
jgi:thiamine-phosphate pyrophosphorylase